MRQPEPCAWSAAQVLPTVFYLAISWVRLPGLQGTVVYEGVRFVCSLSSLVKLEDALAAVDKAAAQALRTPACSSKNITNMSELLGAATYLSMAVGKVRRCKKGRPGADPAPAREVLSMCRGSPLMWACSLGIQGCGWCARPMHKLSMGAVWQGGALAVTPVTGSSLEQVHPGLKAAL